MNQSEIFKAITERTTKPPSDNEIGKLFETQLRTYTLVQSQNLCYSQYVMGQFLRDQNGDLIEDTNYHNLLFSALAACAVKDDVTNFSKLIYFIEPFILDKIFLQRTVFISSYYILYKLLTVYKI